MDAFDVVDRKAIAERVVAGNQLSGSPKLCAFFLYVVDCALRDRPEEATEQQIGVHVFGRKPGYSSSDDSIVRSQARLLRQKLTAHFSSDGIDEPMVIEIPKGHYLPIFRERSNSVSIQGENDPDGLENGYTDEALNRVDDAADLIESKDAAARRLRGSLPRIWLLMLIVLTAGVMGGAWGHQRWSTRQARESDPLWTPFLDKTGSTLVIYSNPLFLGDPVIGLKLADPDAKGLDPEQQDETYTGTGEVASVHQLTQFFDAHDASFVLKRSRLVTWDEARLSNLIFVGASTQNNALHDLPALSDFSIALDEHNRGYVMNQHPLQGEPSRFPVQDRTQETAILAFLPGLEPGTHLLIFSGLTTIGTQAAVEFACRPENVAGLAQKAGMDGKALHPFESVLQVEISKGVAVHTKLLYLHKH